jgi:hypothetical protein
VATALEPAAGPPLSPRNASYSIDIRLDPAQRTLEGRQVVTWTNLRSRPTDELWFHLFWNAWRNSRSTWMVEDRLRNRSERKRKIREEDWGYIEVLSTTLLPDEEGPMARDLTPTQRFASPDDGNPEDRTVLVVSLPEPVGPRDSVRVEMRWRAKVPRTFARTGYRGEFFFIAHGFPALGVFEEAGWNCHQFHAGTEFYSDYGVYDVSLTLPARFVVGATGREVGTRANPDGTVTHRFQQADVHTFAWTASPDYVVREARFEAPGLPAVDLRLLMQPEHLGQTERHLAAVRAALQHYGTWYGPYHYGHLTVVDPAWRSGAGGMEYPTLITCGTRWLNPPGGDSPESVTVHEAGHQFWYGIVGNNEFEHAWLDEGLNTFSTLRALDAVYPPRVLVRRYLRPPRGEGEGFLPLRFPGIEIPRLPQRVAGYRALATADEPSRPSFRYFPSAHSALSYSKTALWLATLERRLGWPTLQRILSTFFQRHAFRHPTPEEFFAVAREVGGEDLDAFFDEVHRSSEAFDYAVESVASVPAAPEGFTEREGRLEYREKREEEDQDGDEGPGKLFRTEVVVRRLGGARFPVDVLLAFEDGHERRELWDGRERWKLIAVEHPARLSHAVVDPDRVLLMDLDPVNNGRLRKPRSRMPAVKWGAKWMIWLQDFLAGWEFFL